MTQYSWQCFINQYTMTQYSCQCLIDQYTMSHCGKWKLDGLAVIIICRQKLVKRDTKTKDNKGNERLEKSFNQDFISTLSFSSD